MQAPGGEAMRIELPRKSERFGANIFFAPVQAYELDSGLYDEPAAEPGPIVTFARQQLHHILRRMAVVVPVRGERLRFIEGVLFAIPAECLVVVVSNSPRAPVDRFHVEQLAVERFCRMSRKHVILVHQKDPLLARAFQEAGYEDLLGEDGLVRDGKAEGMIIAMVLSHLAKRRYVGFIDADNYSPGAAYEYVQEYAAGFALANTPYSMVRILWQSKPKVVEGHLFFARWGRTSRLTNHFLNALVSRYTGFETDVIATGNAGEHALTTELALRLQYASGYAVEPQHFVSLLEDFGGELPSPYPGVMRRGVEVYQMESRNPHFHEAGADDHIHDMARAALGVIHGSPLCPEDVRDEIVGELMRLGALDDGAEVHHPHRYPRLDTMDFDRFHEAVAERLRPFAGEDGAPRRSRDASPRVRRERWMHGDRLAVGRRYLEN